MKQRDILTSPSIYCLHNLYIISLSHHLIAVYILMTDWLAKIIVWIHIHLELSHVWLLVRVHTHGHLRSLDQLFTILASHHRLCGLMLLSSLTLR